MRLVQLSNHNRKKNKKRFYDCTFCRWSLGMDKYCQSCLVNTWQSDLTFIGDCQTDYSLSYGSSDDNSSNSKEFM